jgi:hypothetical protein
MFVLSQQNKAFMGATVRNAVVIIFPEGRFPPLMGTITAKGVALQQVGNKCRVQLAAQP